MIEHLWHNWNWGGIGFCAAMLALLLSSGWATRKLQQWAEQPENKKAGRTLQQAIEEALERRESEKQWTALGNKIDSRDYRAPWHPVHIIDFERSQILVQPDGSVIANCAVQGCNEATVIGRNIAQATIVEDGRMS